MSDWEDEPTSGRGFGDKPAETQKEVSGWSDDEGNGDKSGGGGTKRFGGGGGGGGERGGYRRGENSGGYRGRQDDENALNLATKLPPIPSSCNEDVVTAFIDRLDLCIHNTTMDEVRELRDYLFTAFRHLVSSEWVRLESLDREEHARKVRKVREAAAKMDSFIMDVNSLLGEADVGTAAQELNAIDQLKQMGINWEENIPNLDAHEIVLPQTTSESSSRSRRSSNAVRTAEPTPPYKVKPIIDVYEKSRRLNEEQQSEVAASIQLENYIEVAVSESLQTYGSSKFANNLNAALVNSHKIRGVKFGNRLELTSRMSWPLGPLLVWPGYPKIYHKIHSFDEVPVEPLNEPPRAGRRTPDNTSSSIQTSRQIEGVRHHRSQNQGLETPDAAYYSRYDATRDEEVAWSATGDGIAVEVANAGRSSTPFKRHSELGFSLSSNMNLSLIRDGEAGDPPMPPEFPMSIFDSGTLMMTIDNEETAIVDAVPSSSEVRSARLGGGTAASTPLHSFRPLLPVINEEQQHHLNQPAERQQLVTAVPRMLTLSPPTNEATLAAEPAAYPSSSGAERHNWGEIFRPRDQIINYSEAMPRRPVQRRRRRRRARTPATLANAVEMPQERIQVEEQVQSTSSQEITTNFMANLLQKASDFVSPSQNKTKALAPPTTPSKSANNPGLDQIEQREIEKNQRPSDPLNLKCQTNEESTLQQARCLLEGTTGDDATKEVLLPAPAAFEKDPKTLRDLPDIISNEKKKEFDSTIDISNISEINLEQPSFPTIEHMEIDTANLSVQAIVTDVQILSGPTTMTTFYNLPDDTSNLTKDVERSELGFRNVVASEPVELKKGQADNSLYYRESVEDLGYIVQHVDMLRLNIDRQKELSLTRKECSEFSSNLSMPAVKVYDPKIVINMPQAKILLVHKVLSALVMQPQVDMRSADFIQNRMEAAASFRLLLDLKAANIINLSKDGQIFSLK